MLDGFVTFFQHLKYLGTWISFSLHDDHDDAKRLPAANASMGAISKIWDDNHVNTYSNYILFRAIPCNIILWRCESWALRMYLLASLKVFLYRGIIRILKIKMCQFIDRHIKKNSTREMFYIIPTVQNQIAFRQLTYLGKLFRREASHIPTCLLTVWCDHPRKVGPPVLTNKQSMVRNIQLVITGVDGSGALYAWVFHALDTQNWHALLNTLKHPSFRPPEDKPNTSHEDRNPLPAYARKPLPQLPPSPSSLT